MEVAVEPLRPRDSQAVTCVGTCIFAVFTVLSICGYCWRAGIVLAKVVLRRAVLRLRWQSDRLIDVTVRLDLKNMSNFCFNYQFNNRPARE